jgi:DNA integrity scanning protein DisA with diadenylate cyclase activity
MRFHKYSEQFAGLFEFAVRVAETTSADAILLLLEGRADWKELRQHAGANRTLIVAVDHADEAEGASEFGIKTVVLDVPEAAVHEKISQALLEGVAQEHLSPGAQVVALYSAFEDAKIDSLSLVRLDDRLGRLTVRDLQKLSTSVPLETLKAVVDIAVEIGREGREGKAVGTMFVVGNTRKVLAHSRPAGFDPVKGYGRKERNIHDPRAREAIKEIAQLDGAFIVAPDGTVESACRLVDSNTADITVSKGLGARHWAGAAISKLTGAIAVTVSQSSGTVRIFQNGEVVLRIEPFRRAMKFREFDFDPPDASEL